MPPVSVYPEADSEIGGPAVDPAEPVFRAASPDVALLTVDEAGSGWRKFMNRIAGSAWRAVLPIVAATLTPFASADTEIWTPIPGTRTPDYGGPLLIERDGIVYPAIKGTRTPDYGASDRLIIRDGKVYNAIPGTNTPDYGSGQRLLRDR
jgi:hypothetical protein